jgi:hypothetical protein
MSCQQSATNPVAIAVEPQSVLHILCVAHADFYQQVILSFSQNMSSPIGTFSGSGEGVTMKLAGGGTTLSQSTGSNSTLYAQFQFSSSGSGGPFQQASVCAPIVVGSSPGPVITTVTSEDLIDTDDNDSYLTIIDLNA